MIVIALLLIFYVLLIAGLCIGFFRLKNESTNFDNQVFSDTKTRFSIIIPFRNEARHLEALLETLNCLDYPDELYEIILINDGSTDRSLEVIENFLAAHQRLELKTLNNKRVSGSPKKDALNLGIAEAKMDWIITTDADCRVPSNWLKHYNYKILREACTFIAGPVCFYEDQNQLLDAFQQLDFLSLQGATIGSFGLSRPFMCNGANLGFLKSSFLRLNGYAANNHIASGDDVFLMQQFLEADAKAVGYLKTWHALVETAPQPDLKSLINQRKRWAAKASAYKSRFAVLVSVLVLLGNASAVAGLFFAEIYYLLILKVAIDFLLIWCTATLFAQKKQLKHYVWVALVYPFFTLYIALVSQFGKFSWKGRDFKK
ncbi:glycosyltransferase family 2 protein [Leeuwenhoekiella nanhaiensis]|uniref:glycosyltransferase family 2 protein n=1 Tax=Leeuwenhoekiella nanhaiensis TaxID=1655491 RepID=UPI00166FD4E3|nr:glycosyltransferase [Leeuwenhoekiella nanhaiensis]